MESDVTLPMFMFMFDPPINRETGENKNRIFFGQPKNLKERIIDDVLSSKIRILLNNFLIEISDITYCFVDRFK